jgi:hypothetical protein
MLTSKRAADHSASGAAECARQEANHDDCRDVRRAAESHEENRVEQM